MGWLRADGEGCLVLIKWIKCGVTDREAFGAAQQNWARVGNQPGFLGQGGGWSRRDPEVAHVFACWADQASHDRFMTESHDTIAGDQTGTYGRIEVRLFRRLMDIGECSETGSAGASLMRLAYCRVQADRQEHFVAAQAEVWNPGMTHAPGMCGGVFGQSGEADFLVLSLWRSATDHQRYLSSDFPDLRRRSGAADDLDATFGDLVALEPSWAVHPGPVAGPGWLPGVGWWAVAVQGGAVVPVPGGGGPVGVDHQGPAELVDDDVVVVPAHQHAVPQGGFPAVGLRRGVVDLAGAGGLGAAPAQRQCPSRNRTACRIPAGTVSLYPASRGMLGPPSLPPNMPRRT